MMMVYMGGKRREGIEIMRVPVTSTMVIAVLADVSWLNYPARSPSLCFVKETGDRSGSVDQIHSSFLT
jgi:hypothetical protein